MGHLLVQSFVEAIVFTIGLCGYYVTFNTYRKIWRNSPDWQSEFLARRRQTTARSYAYKATHGSALVVTFALLLPLAVLLLLFLSPLDAILAFPHDKVSEVVTAIGNLLLVLWGSSRLLQRHF